jgi:hypothetical protein
MTPRAWIKTAAVLALGLGPALLLAAGPEAPATTGAVLGGGGELYVAIAGAFGDLFPEDGTQPADTAVLALDVIRPKGERERTLVPGSEGPEVEGVATLVVEDATDRLYAVWESKRTPTVSRLLLAHYGEDGWSTPIEISGDVSPLKDEPRILIARDRFTVGGERGTLSSRTRTAIHVVWREEQGEAAGYYYTPVLLEGGRYLGWNPVVALGELDSAPAAEGPEAAVELLRNPELAPGRDINSVVVGFLSPRSGRVITAEVRLIPGEVGFLADDFRGQIIEIGAHDRSDLGALADKFRGQIIEIGRRLNGGVMAHFGERAHRSFLDLLEDSGDRPIEALADDFRGQIIEIGARLTGGPGGATREKLVEIAPPDGPGEEPEPGAPSVRHLLRIQAVSSYPAPPLGEVTARFFVSEDGERVLVGWLHRNTVYYTETVAEPAAGQSPWSPVKTLALTEELGPFEAADILEARVRRR